MIGITKRAALYMTSWMLTKYYGLRFRKKIEPLPSEPVSKDRKKVIVSLTTIPSRITSSLFVVRLIMNQTVRPNEIHLYLGKDKFQEEDLPNEMKNLAEIGLKIIFVEDIGPHTKYFYAIQENPEAIVITVDDDILYPLNLIGTLLDCYYRYPRAVSCIRAHEIMLDCNNELLPYNSWVNKVSGYTVPSHKLLATGVGGVFFPAYILPEETFDVDAINRDCLKADDIWLKFMEWRKQIPVVKAQEKRGKLLIINNTQGTTLLKDNVNNNRNDAYVKGMIDQGYVTKEELVQLFTSIDVKGNKDMRLS